MGEANVLLVTGSVKVGKGLRAALEREGFRVTVMEAGQFQRERLVTQPDAVVGGGEKSWTAG